MDLKKKISYILYNSYKYDNKKYNSDETKEFFDLELSRSLSNNTSGNSQRELLSYFDFSDIFNNNQFGELQINLLKFMIIKGVSGIDSLIENIPFSRKATILNQLYIDINDFRFFNNIFLAMKSDEEKINFFNFMINHIKNEEIVLLFGTLYKEKKYNVLLQIIQNKKAVDIASNNINAPFFYEMVEELNLPDIFVKKRNDNLHNIIENYQEYDVKDVKNAYAELYFHDISNNIYLDLKTILDYANADEIVKEYLGDQYEEFSNLVIFFSNDNELSDLDISVLNNIPSINYNIVSKIFNLCQKHFKKTISEQINSDVYSGILPRIIKSTSGKDVKLYDIENQGENQKNVPMLISTVPIYNDNAVEFKKDYYSQKNGEVVYHRRSFSLINETKLNNLFGRKGRIAFGFEDLSGRNLSSSSLIDGGTDGNTYRYGKQRRVRCNTLLPVDKFVSQTSGHNEILLEMDGIDEAIKPSFILILELPPTQLEIDIAAEFDIPIRYINKEKYQQITTEYVQPKKEYNYYVFNKRTVHKINEKRSTL